MALHPQIVQALKAMEAAKLRPIEEMTPAEARAQMDAVARARAQAFPPTPLDRIEEREIPGPAGPMRARFYWPTEAAGKLPALLYFHGGGHVIGSLDSHDGTARNLCAGAGALVVSLDYRMGPEHRFPAAVEDSWAALTWLHANAVSLGADPGRLAVGGDSAGANLAAVMALMARDAGGPALRLQVLVYPVGDYNLTGESYRRFASGYGPLTREAMVWFQRHYLNSVEEANDWRASPLKAAGHAGVAPAIVILAECDVLLDDGKAYAEALRRAGVPVEEKEYAGMIHGFFSMAPAIDVAVAAQADAVAALKRAFA